MDGCCGQKNLSGRAKNNCCWEKMPKELEKHLIIDYPKQHQQHEQQQHFK